MCAHAGKELPGSGGAVTEKPTASPSIMIWAPISDIRIDTSGYATLYFTRSLLSPAGACRAVNMDNAFAFDATTDAGKSILEVATSRDALAYPLTMSERCWSASGITPWRNSPSDFALR